MSEQKTDNKISNGCIAWKVHPGYGHVCFSMCSDEKRKMCIDEFSEKIKSPKKAGDKGDV
jgi:hypothetical protein